MKSSFYKLIVVVILSMLIFHIYDYLLNCFISVDYEKVSYRINPRLINVNAFIITRILNISNMINMYWPFTIIGLLIYIQTSLHRSRLKTLLFLLVYPLFVYLSMHITFYLICTISMSISMDILYISYTAYPVLHSLVYTLFILLVVVICSQLLKLQADPFFENDKVNNYSQSILYSSLFVYSIWQVTAHMLSYNFFINYYNDSRIDSLVNALSSFYTLFILTYLVLWTYPYLSNSNKRNNFIRLSCTFFVICVFWLLLIVEINQIGILYDLMRWSREGDEYKKSIIFFLIFAAYIFFMGYKINTGVHYLQCFILFFLVLAVLYKRNHHILSSLSLQLSYIAVCTVIFYIIHTIAFRIAFYKRKNINQDLTAG